ncbi:MAG TPA: hypothetical protein VLN74_09730 [Ilumatobacteraceae bacterium]|nr:hypothetical protein [Ilumatobacteraceae bacterium]
MGAVHPAELKRAVDDLIADAAVRSEGKPWHAHAHRPEVSVTSVRVHPDGDSATVELRFEDARHPGERFGARLRLRDNLFGRLDFEAERPETVVAEHILIALGELTFAGGDPQSWNADDEGTRWYEDDVF